MEEPASWKGHGFTLLVFGGIVFLCSIFFVLGMLVGHGQGLRAAKATLEADQAKIAAVEARKSDEARSGIASFESVETGKPKAATPPPADPPVPAVSEPAPALNAAEEKLEPKPSASEKMFYLQVFALEKEATAKKELETLKTKGFPAVIWSGDGTNKLYRVQVGPYSSDSDAETAKRKLEGLGYKTLRK